MLTYFQGKHNESECYKSTEDNIEFVVARSDSAKILEVMEQPLNLIASFVQLLVVLPWLLCIALRRHDRNATFPPNSTARDGIGISFVHHHSGVPFQFCFLEELSPFGRIAGIAGTQDECKTCMSSGGDQMDLGGQSST